MPRIRTFFVVTVIVAVTAALCVVGFAALEQAEAKRAESTQDAPPDRGVAVSVESVARRDVALRVSVSGFLEPYTQITISAQIPGQLEVQHVEASDLVSAGQPLYEMDASLRKVDLDKAAAAVARARSELDLAKEDVKRIERLQTQDSANPREVRQVNTALTAAKATFDQARASVEEATILLGKTVVRAPIAGLVAQVHTRQGEYAHVGQPIVEIIEVDSLKLTVQLNDSQIVAFTLGDPVAMRASARPGEVFDGRILRIHPRAARDSRMFEVEIEVPNPDHRLRPGFFVHAVLSQQRAEGRSGGAVEVITVPRTAVFERYRQQYCYVVRGADGEPFERAYLTLLETAPFLPDMKDVQVLSGVQAGERVITAGLLHVTHEAIVRVTDE